MCVVGRCWCEGWEEMMKGVKQCGRGTNRELFEISVMCWEMCVEAKDCRHITYNTTELSTQWGSTPFELT